MEIAILPDLFNHYETKSEKVFVNVSNLWRYKHKYFYKLSMPTFLK